MEKRTTDALLTTIKAPPPSAKAISQIKMKKRSN
jgi:hypothetical protein